MHTQLENTGAQRLLVAFSGGLDSTVLLKLASDFAGRNDLACSALHVNHQLTPNASDWVTHCAGFCRQYQISLEVMKVEISSASRTSLEAEAREARYGAMRQWMDKYSLLLTGQHLDDQVETLLLQLKRGAGPKGLAAMPSLKPFAGGWIGRPLLHLSRQQLESWASQSGLSWIEDESNASVEFDRNFLRHQILPLMKQRWPGVDKAISRSAELCAESQNLLDQLAQIDLGEQAPNKPLPLSLVQSLSPERQRNLIRFWLSQQNVAMPPGVRLNNLLTQLAQTKPDRHPELVWQQQKLVVYADALHLVRVLPACSGLPSIPVPNQEVLLPHGIGVLKLGQANGAEEGLLLRAARPNEEVSIRFGIASVRSCPYKRVGYHSLGKRMHELRIPPWQRDRIPLIFFGDKLAAVGDYWVEKGFAASDSKASYQIIWKRATG
jgi:tRNA(Ile)-lysidine synthase